jgi:hypothetical protein
MREGMLPMSTMPSDAYMVQKLCGDESTFVDTEVWSVVGMWTQRSPWGVQIQGLLCVVVTKRITVSYRTSKGFTVQLSDM